MTGMIHSGHRSEVCPECGRPSALEDWSCPQCGRILDRYLFSTVTAKSVSGAARDAFRAGYEACMSRWKETRSVELGTYRPVPGHETAYRAGWRDAAGKIEAKDERKRGRRRGLQLLAFGGLLTLVGGSLTLNGGLLGGWDLVILAAGVLNVVLGTSALITGNSDACPPPLPGTSPAESAPDEPPNLIAPSRILPQILPRTLQTAEGTVFITWVLLAANVAVFLAMLVAGTNVLDPSIDGLIRWGANYGPRTTAGEWWRLLTSMFLHVGALHIAFNMFALWQVGPVMERLAGKTGFTLLYLVAGLAGGLASLAWNPYLVSAGASGAIFGLYGGLLGYLTLRHHSLPSEAVAPMMKGALGFVGYNVIYGMSNPHIDMAAHIGGVVSGFLCGLASSLPSAAGNERLRRVRNAIVAVAAAILLILSALNLPHAVDLQAHFKRFGALEKSTTTRVNDAMRRYGAGKIPKAEFASVMNTQVFSEWNAEHDALAKARGLRAPQSRIVSTVVSYMELRRDSWLAFAAAVSDGKPEKLKEAAQKGMQANKQLLELARFVKNP